jgi:hypothetical protein
MRASMGLLKNEHGVYVVRKKVPARLREAVATLKTNNPGRIGKPSQSFLQRSLRTKDLHQAKVLAKPVLIEFDQVLAKAEALIADTPMRTTLTQAEIELMANWHFASLLAGHDEFVRQAPDAERELRQEAGAESWVEPIPEFGMSGGQMADANETFAEVLPAAEKASARGDIRHVSHHIEDVLAVFRIRLDRKGVAYRDLGIAILRANVRALRAIEQRTKGEPIDTPKLIVPNTHSPANSESLRTAFEGWRKARNPAAGTLAEYVRAIDLFVELHGDMPIIQIRKAHARAFREALQDVPRSRIGGLKGAVLPELAAWGKEHPEAPKIATGTVNKLLGGVQVVAVWARDNGIIPDDVAWADPFAGMRLEEAGSTREPFAGAELRTLFASPVFTKQERPTGGKGEAAFWLPLLALFTGARLSELASLTVADAEPEEEKGTYVLTITEDAARAKALKTEGSARTVPVHSELVRLGWAVFVERIRSKRGGAAWLFPLVSPEVPGGVRAWSKWFNRHLRALGITNSNKVFHSFRHGFKDALRAAQVSEDLNDALTGHAGGTVGRSYGAKAMLRRFGIDALKNAVQSLKYPGLDLSRVSSDGSKPKARTKFQKAATKAREDHACINVNKGQLTAKKSV